MNTPFKRSFFILSLISVGFVVSANAQRQHNGGQRGGGNYSGRNNGSFSNRGGGNYSSRTGADYSNRNSGGDFNRQRNFDRPVDVNRQSNVSYDRRITNNTTNDRIADHNWGNQNSSLGRDTRASNVNRDVVRNSSGYTGFNPQRNDRRIDINNTVRYNNYSRYPAVYNYDRRGGYSMVRYNYYAPRRYVYVGAPRYSIMPRTFISINFGGYPYWYDRGCFYGYYDGFYEPVFAPIGIHVTILPPGYFSIYVGPRMYYYYEGIYYRRFNDRVGEYEVIEAPMGAVVTALPKGATVAVVNGEKFYEFNGTYYKEGTNSKNEVVYTVVGKNGSINNTEEQPPVTTTKQAPQIGDEITTLPENSRQVTINGEVLYVTPDNLYLKAQTNNNTTTYKVVGKTENN